MVREYENPCHFGTSPNHRECAAVKPVTHKRATLLMGSPAGVDSGLSRWAGQGNTAPLAIKAGLEVVGEPLNVCALGKAD